MMNPARIGDEARRRGSIPVQMMEGWLTLRVVSQRHLLWRLMLRLLLLLVVKDLVAGAGAAQRV